MESRRTTRRFLTHRLGFFFRRRKLRSTRRSPRSRFHFPSSFSPGGSDHCGKQRTTSVDKPPTAFCSAFRDRFEGRVFRSQTNARTTGRWCAHKSQWSGARLERNEADELKRHDSMVGRRFYSYDGYHVSPRPRFHTATHAANHRKASVGYLLDTTKHC